MKPNLNSDFDRRNKKLDNSRGHKQPQADDTFRYRGNEAEAMFGRALWGCLKASSYLDLFRVSPGSAF